MPQLTDQQRTMIQAVMDGKSVQNFWHGKWETMEPDEAVRFIAGWNSDDGALRVAPQPIELWNWVLVARFGAVAAGRPHTNKATVLEDAKDSRHMFDGESTLYLIHTVIDRETHSLGITSSIIQ